MSKFDGVLGRSNQPIEAVPKVLSAKGPREERRPRLPEDNRIFEEATTSERQDCLSEGESSARHERRR